MTHTKILYLAALSVLPVVVLSLSLDIKCLQFMKFDTVQQNYNLSFVIGILFVPGICLIIHNYIPCCVIPC